MQTLPDVYEPVSNWDGNPSGSSWSNMVQFKPHLRNPGLELRTSRGWGWGGHPAVTDCPVEEANVGDWTDSPDKWWECVLMGLVKMYSAFYLNAPNSLYTFASRYNNMCCLFFANDWQVSHVHAREWSHDRHNKLNLLSIMISWLINYPNLILSYPDYLSRFADVVSHCGSQDRGQPLSWSLTLKGMQDF